MRCAARRRPWAGVAWWKTSHTCPVKVGDVDTDMRLICHEGLTEPFFLSLEGIQLPIRTPARKSSPRSSSQFSCTVPDLPGTRSTQAGRGMILPSRVHDASELTWAPSASVLVMPHASHQPPAPEPPQKRAGSSDAARRHGLIWDHTVFHVVASCRARPAIVAPSKRNCRISQRITRTPKRARGAHTRSSCSRNITVWQVVSRHIHRRLNHRNLAGTPAQGASITSTTTRPWP